jgi:alpha-glucosidase
MRNLILFLISIVWLESCHPFHENSSNWYVASPDGNLQVEITLDSLKAPIYSVFLKGDVVVQPSRLGIALSDESYSFIEDLEYAESTEKEVQDEYIAVSGKRRHCSYHANERTIVFRNACGKLMGLIFQVSNHGVAFRYKLNNQIESTVDSETSEFNLPEKSMAWIQRYRHMGNDYEMTYTQRLLDTMNLPAYYLPGLFETPQKIWVFISDASVNGDYAACQLSHIGSGKLAIKFPDQTYDWEEGRHHPWFKIVYEESAKIQVPANLLTPWRAMIISDDLGDIVESNLIEDLSEPSRITDQGWIEPGVAVFPWWGYSLANDDPDMLKDYIDLAAEMNWRYIEFDIGLMGNNGGYAAGYWRNIEYIPEVIDYARAKDIKVYGWDERRNLDTREKRDGIFSKYCDWGVAGIKMDFVNSDKQEAMKWYEEATSHAAEYHLLVSFHGAITPRGLRRTFPNIMTYEGVRGAEYYKWPDNDPTPEHNCSLPYTRNVSGPMDYTPTSFSTPRRTSTYAHELALPFIFESGWICMADKPEEFRRCPAKDLLQNLHAAWDDIRFIDGYPGEYCCLARRKGDDWFVAAINADMDRQIEIPFNFLPGNNYRAKLYTDDGRDGLRIGDLNISNNSIEKFDLVKNGGFVIHLAAINSTH